MTRSQKVLTFSFNLKLLTYILDKHCTACHLKRLIPHLERKNSHVDFFFFMPKSPNVLAQSVQLMICFSYANEISFCKISKNKKETENVEQQKISVDLSVREFIVSVSEKY